MNDAPLIRPYAETNPVHEMLDRADSRCYDFAGESNAVAREQVTRSLGIAGTRGPWQRKRGLALTNNERAGLTAFLERLAARYAGLLERVVLFGSKARGDADAESDIDLLVLLDTPREDYRRYWNGIVDLAWDIEREFGLVFSLIVKHPADYALMREHSLLLAKNIERDGVVLWTNKQNVRTSSLASPGQPTTS